MDTLLYIKRGNALTATCTLTHTSTGTPIDLTGCTILFTAKELNDDGTDDTDAIISSTLAISEAVNGTAILSLSATDTDVTEKTYKADVRVYKAGEVDENTDPFYVVVQKKVTKRNS
jgi:hypothetical protein